MNNDKIPILIPVDQEEFWNKIREILRTEMGKMQASQPEPVTYQVPGLVKKPIYRSSEVCSMLQISRQTLHSWAKEGLLKPHKIKSRTFYLATDIEAILQMQLK